MKTTINNNQKIFMLTGDMNKSIFCNLKDVPSSFNSFDNKDDVKIFFFWNNKMKRVYKTKLNTWFKSNQIKALFLSVG